MTTELIVCCSIPYFFIACLYLVLTFAKNGTFYFNPVENYEDWESLNWFGVLTFTLFLNVFFAPFAIIYWVGKFFIFIFTFGRR